MKNMLYLMLFLILANCGHSELESKMEDLQAARVRAEANLAVLEAQIEEEGPLVHLVFFKLQETADQNALVGAIKKLDDIPEVLDLEVGPFQDLGDARAMQQFQLLMTMSFEDTAAYQRYQAHPIHLNLKEEVKPYLTGPPVTYDFIKQ